MSIISIKLEEDYKSFDEGFETVLEGDTIILSGINGSGKSQLINIIRGVEQVERADPMMDPMNPTTNKKIHSLVKIDGQVLNQKCVEFKGFKDNFNISEILKPTSAELMRAVDEAYRIFKSGRLDPKKSPDYSSSCIKANKILSERFGKVDNSISESEFKTVLRQSGFLWQQDDKFSNVVGMLFYNHAMAIAQGRQDAGAVAGPAFDETTLGTPPWTELNELFSELNLEYRFKNNYTIFHAELDETPCLYSINKKGELLESETRALRDLSDGEKTIISLCFISLRKIEGEDKRLLLLDELDAVLNPSLTEKLFVVLQKYYVNKGIDVIITTHSPATISLAPKNATFYEVFKKNYSKQRVHEVNKDEYEELKIVNKRFYDKIENQEQRIQDLKVLLEKNEDFLIITEGKTDWKYMIGALKYFHAKNEFTDILEDHFYRFGSQEDVSNSICGTNDHADLGEAQLNKFLSNEIALRTGDVGRRKMIWIGVFDSDTNTKIKSNPVYGIHSFKIEPSGISTEFLFKDEEIKSLIDDKRLYLGTEFDQRTCRHKSENLNLGAGSQKKAGKKVIIDNDVYDANGINQSLSKEEFSQAIYNHNIEISDHSWENFRHIFEKIESLVPKSKEEFANQ